MFAQMYEMGLCLILATVGGVLGHLLSQLICPVDRTFSTLQHITLICVGAANALMVRWCRIWISHASLQLAQTIFMGEFFGHVNFVTFTCCVVGPPVVCAVCMRAWANSDTRPGRTCFHAIPLDEVRESHGIPV